jgi:hypothetical protein
LRASARDVTFAEQFLLDSGQHRPEGITELAPHEIPCLCEDSGMIDINERATNPFREPDHVICWNWDRHHRFSLPLALKKHALPNR